MTGQTISAVGVSGFVALALAAVMVLGDRIGKVVR